MLDVRAQHQPAALTRSSSVWRLLGLVLSVYAMVALMEFILWDSGHLPGAGTIGAEQTQFAPAPKAGPGFVTVNSVARASPLDLAGVVAGDRLRFDPVFDYLRYRRSGEVVHAVVDRAGQRSAVTLIAVPRTAPPDWQAVRFYIGNLIPVIFGAFILWRSRGRATALLLGGALVTFGPPAPLTSMMWEGGRGMFLFSATLNSTCVVAVTVLVLAFSMRFVDEAVGGIGRRQWIAFRVYAAFNVMVLISWCLVADRVDPLPLVGDSTAILGISEYTGIAASLAYLWIGWRRSERQQRERFALFLAGVAALAVSRIIPFVVYVQFGQLFSESHPLLIVAELLSGVVAPLLLTHAILRHRVLDLSFILNRTLVYGTVSAILLVSFGLIEWSIERFVKIEGRERNALVDAAIALGVYLAFHRFRHATEHRLEAFFFREWHAKEAALRRSISQSRFITAREPMVHAATLALRQFSGGAAVTFYLKNRSNGFGPFGDTGPAMDRNAPLVVAMRAEPTPHRLDSISPASTSPASTVPSGADFALPMMHRNELLGFVLLGSKPGDSDYRTDEVDLLGWATHQIGLDLHALNVERLEAMVLDQNRQIEILQVVTASRPTLS